MDRHGKCWIGKEVEFKEFVEKLASVLQGGNSTIEFTRSVFEAIVAPEPTRIFWLVAGRQDSRGSITAIPPSTEFPER